MMRNTPRTFVGPVVLNLRGRVCAHVAEEACDMVLALDGVTHCELDLAAGTVLVTAVQPVDRTEVVAALDRAGCRVRS
jgi:hypothetical protein